MRNKIFMMIVEIVVRAILEALDRDVKGLRGRIDNSEAKKDN